MITNPLLAPIHHAQKKAKYMPPSSFVKYQTLTRPERATHKLLILKVIISRRPLTPIHALLLAIHLRYLATTRRLIGLLVIADLDESREAQTNPLLSGGIKVLSASSPILRTQRQVSCTHLPHEARLKPDVWLVRVHLAVLVKGLWALDDDVRELGVQGFKD